MIKNVEIFEKNNKIFDKLRCLQACKMYYEYNIQSFSS